MKTSLLLSGLCILCALFSQAQTPVYKNSFRIGVDNTTIRLGEKGTPLRYTATYARHLAQDRLVVEGNLGYFDHYVYQWAYPYDYYFKADHLRLITADITLLYDVLKSNRHALRLGGGPSVWYQNNNRVSNMITITTTVGGGAVDNVSFNTLPERGWLTGFNLTGEYEFAVTPRVVIGAKAAIITLIGNKAGDPIYGGMSTAGLNVGYRF